MQTLCKVGSYGLAFALGALITFLCVQKNAPDKAHDFFDTQTGAYPLINPLLSCGDYEDQPPAVIQHLKESLESYIAAQTSQQTLVHASVYYRDFNDGPWFGINLYTPFSPGSLLKLPLLVSLFRQMEADPSFASTTLTLSQEVGIPQLVPPAHPIVVGQPYSVDQLIHNMIVESDNNAAELLFEHADQRLFSRTFTDLGVHPPQSNEDYTITVRTYASFFRILYNSTFLSHESSERALELLTQVAYKKALVAGVPSSIKVAHKFGERQVSSLSNMVQLHDCGIVYVPNNPYLLCVMTQGYNLETLEGIIAHISKMVYDQSGS
jgi:beta-lactamase class A